MKKTSDKQLVLTSITIGRIDNGDLAAAVGGQMPVTWTKSSRCMTEVCDTDRAANCPRTF